MAGWLTAEAFDVHGDGCEYVLHVGFWLSSVAAAAHAVSVGELVDGALHPGADRVSGFPFRCLLLGADACLQVAEFAWWEPTLRASLDFVHRGRSGHGWHWLLVNLATIRGAAVGEEVG